MDILDTSAIRGMRKDDIHAIARHRDVRVSPFSVYEILCHLDEQKPGETPDEAFRRRRGMLTKIQGLQILEEPLTQHIVTVGAQSLANPTRFEDRDITKRIIEEVAQASSLADLHKRTIALTNGSRGIFKDIAKNVRAILDAEEKQYGDDVRKMWLAIQERSSATSPAALTDDELWECLKATMSALKRRYEQHGVVESALLENVARTMYTYWGYVLVRLRKYTKDPAGELVVPANDTEDAFICMHLDHLAKGVLVTDDTNTIDALKAALGLWRKHVPDKIAPACAVMSIQEYTDEFLSSG